MGNNHVVYSYELVIPPRDVPLTTCCSKSSKWKIMKIPKGMKIIGVICKLGASRHSNRLEAYGINIVWEFNGAFPEDRKNLSRHPLNRNRL